MKELYIRNLMNSDKEFIHQNVTFPEPNVDDALFFVRKVITDRDGNIIGVGLARLTCEAMFILNQNMPKTLLARTAVELTQAMVSDGKAKGMDASHAFIDDKPFAEFLKKHLKFENSKGGQVLYLDFDNV